MPVFLLHSWSYWNSSASIIAAAQAQQTLGGPTLDVLGTDGKWRVGIEDMGVSAGLPRTILVDLSNVLKRGERVVRMRSNRTLYYDQASVADAVGHLDFGSVFLSNVRVTELPLLRGNLRWLGYPKRVLPDGKLPKVPDYQQIEPQSEWGAHAGMLTRTGDVTPLLTKSDDKFVVMNHGEEIALSFEPVKPPHCPKVGSERCCFTATATRKAMNFTSRGRRRLSHCRSTR